MREVTLIQIFNHHIARKYLSRSGIVHAIACAYHAFKLAKEYDVSVDLAAKSALLHDMGHYTWYSNGKWDYDLYKQNDIHAIKGAERAHKLLIRLGENPIIAKEIALAILFHTDSYMPEGFIKRTPCRKSSNWQTKWTKSKAVCIITGQSIERKRRPWYNAWMQ